MVDLCASVQTLFRTHLISTVEGPCTTAETASEEASGTSEGDRNAVLGLNTAVLCTTLSS